MYFIGAVPDKDTTKVALYDGDYRLVIRKDGAADVKALCLDVMEDAGISPSDVSFVGIASDTPDPDAYALGLEKELGIKCFCASVIGARALGEAYTSGDLSTLVLLKVDDTIDCGIVIDKKIYDGIDHKGGSIAHFVINYGGYDCECGRKGCFEAYASNKGLRHIAADAGVKDADTLTVKKLFTLDSPEAEVAKTNYVNFLACGITNVINLFQPRELVLEGEYTEVGYQLMSPLMDFLLREQYTHSAPNKCNVRTPNNESDTALLGAALIGRD